MQSHSFNAQITFCYINGESETFNVFDPIEAETIQQELQQEFRRLFDRQWWILHLPDQTVCINVNNILKVEIKPPITQVQGEGVFATAERVTALSRSYREA